MMGWLEISFNGPATPDDKTFQFGLKTSCVNRNYSMLASPANKMSQELYSLPHHWENRRG